MQLARGGEAAEEEDDFASRSRRRGSPSTLARAAAKASDGKCSECRGIELEEWNVNTLHQQLSTQEAKVLPPLQTP